jgi:hypothetical protein
MGRLNGLVAAISVVAAVAWAGSAGATPVTTVIVDTGNINTTLGDSGVGEVQIFLDLVASASTSTGHVGSQTGLPGTPVITFDTSPVSVKFANGFAGIDALKVKGDPVLYQDLTISVPKGWTFTDLEFSVLSAPDFTVTGSNGASSTITDPPNGDKAFTTVATNGTDFTSVTISSTVGFDKFNHFEISGLAPAVPEPSTWAMMILGFGGIGFMAYRRKSSAGLQAA